MVGLPVEIEIYSDVVCPWCYLGKTRLDAALASFEAEVTVRKNGTSVSGASIMGLMMLAAGPGTQVTIEAAGAEAAQAVAALAALVDGAFDEE